jgi:hypothetical protein
VVEGCCLVGVGVQRQQSAMSPDALDAACHHDDTRIAQVAMELGGSHAGSLSPSGSSASRTKSR